MDPRQSPLYPRNSPSIQLPQAAIPQIPDAALPPMPAVPPTPPMPAIGYGQPQAYGPNGQPLQPQPFQPQSFQPQPFGPQPSGPAFTANSYAQPLPGQNAAMGTMGAYYGGVAQPPHPPTGYEALGPPVEYGGLPAIQDYDPYEGTEQTGFQFDKRILLIAGGAILVIGLLIAVVALSSSSKRPANNPAARSTGIALPEVINRSEDTLDLNNRVDVSKVIRAQNIKAGLNQQVNLSSGLSLMTKAVGSYDSTSAKPAEGKKIIVILLAAGNHSTSRSISLSYLDFKLLDSNNQTLNPIPATQQITNNPLANPVELKPGEQIEGRLVYEVGNQDQSWTLLRRETYRKKSDDSTFVIEARFSLGLDATSKSSTGSSNEAPATTAPDNSSDTNTDTTSSGGTSGDE